MNGDSLQPGGKVEEKKEMVSKDSWKEAKLFSPSLHNAQFLSPFILHCLPAWWLLLLLPSSSFVSTFYKEKEGFEIHLQFYSTTWEAGRSDIWNAEHTLNLLHSARTSPAYFIISSFFFFLWQMQHLCIGTGETRPQWCSFEGLSELKQLWISCVSWTILTEGWFFPPICLWYIYYIIPHFQKG